MKPGSEETPGKDSSNLDFHIWDDLMRLLCEGMNSTEGYQGIVVTHGTDTLVYSAAAASFALVQIKMPIIFTASQLPLSRPSTDAPNNFIGAVIVASGVYETKTWSFPGIAVFFNNQLFAATRLQKVDASDINAFDSPGVELLGFIGCNGFLFDSERLTPRSCALLSNPSATRTSPCTRFTFLYAFLFGSSILENI